jgi:hypothetical protein
VDESSNRRITTKPWKAHWSELAGKTITCRQENKQAADYTGKSEWISSLGELEM